MVFPLKVEPGCVFVMGDNRMNSKDSRDPVIGLIDKREILGKALFLVWPGKATLTGQRDLERIFTSMGFTIENYSEIVDDYHCFEALNIPKHHPARDMQDTFYIDEEIVLRSQTSTGQVRVMEKKQPPIKILSPGRVYRSDDDASHSPMFHQCEGLVVDKGISLCDLQGLLDEFVKLHTLPLNVPSAQVHDEGVVSI